jgi:1,4-dihydroxy-6-naphthoate synthase
MHFEIGFSPCPNDTFIFDALVNNKIDTQGFTFTTHLQDVQTLNKWALQNKLPITKISYGAMPLLLQHYKILNSGSALGNGVGPILITHPNLQNEVVDNCMVAIPGQNTTAHLLFSLAYPNAKNKIFMQYDDIENFVKEQKGLGVIIHENRFTYLQKGLEKIIDLGDYWEQQYHVPIPLGGIVIDKNIDLTIQKKIDELIKKSIEYAFTQYPFINQYIQTHSQEMSEEVMRQHIDLYVNNFSIKLGINGRFAITKLIEIYQQLHHTPAIITNDIFVEE